jgi:hypothetical protein
LDAEERRRSAVLVNSRIAVTFHIVPPSAKIKLLFVAMLSTHHIDVPRFF